MEEQLALQYSLTISGEPENSLNPLKTVDVKRSREITILNVFTPLKKRFELSQEVLAQQVFPSLFKKAVADWT